MPRFSWLLLLLAGGCATVSFPDYPLVELPQRPVVEIAQAPAAANPFLAGAPSAVPAARTEYSARPEFPRELLPLESAPALIVPRLAAREPQESIPAPPVDRVTEEAPEFSAAPRRELPPLPLLPDEFAPLPVARPLEPGPEAEPVPPIQEPIPLEEEPTPVEPEAFPLDEESLPAVPEPLREDEIPLLIPVPLPPEEDLMLDRLSPSAPKPKPLAPPEPAGPSSLVPGLPGPDESFGPGPGPTATPGLQFAPEPVWNPQHPALNQLPPTEDQFVELPGEFRPFPGPADLVTESASAGWESLYQSAERRPVQTARLGRGPLRVLVIASLNGNESATGELLDAWVAAQYRPAESTLLLVRNPNPDGQERQQSANAAGVDLNRNFPARDFVADPAAGTGAYPGSEVETRTLLRLLAEFRPQRIIYLKQSPGRQRRLATSASARSIAQAAIEGTPFQLEPQPDLLPGSLESFVARDLQLELIILGCPQQETAADFWKAHAGVFKKLATLAASQPPEPERPAPQPAGPVAAPTVPRVSEARP